MKNILFICIFQFIITNIYAQAEKEINIHVASDIDNNLPFAHLTVNESNHLITDENGDANFSTSASTANIRISHIGFITIDTVINFQENSTFEFILASNNYTIDPITISDKQRLFERDNWYIKDIILHEFGFLVSASEKSKQYIYLFDKQGNEILKARTKFKHTTVIKGLGTGYYHLMSELEGMEFMISTDTIIFLKTSPIEQYAKTINQFKYTNKNYTISEEWKHHNKNYMMSVIDNKTYEKKPFYNSFDEESYARAQSVRNEIIGKYYQDSQDPVENLLGPGMEGTNIVADGTWSGDLEDLIASDTILKMYNYYKSIYANNVEVSSKIKGGKLYIMDDLKRKISIFELESEMINLDLIEIDLPSEIQKGRFVSCNHEEELVITDREKFFSFNTNSYEFIPLEFEKQEYFYPKTQFVSDNQLHVLARKSRLKQKMSVYRSELIKKTHLSATK